MNKYAQYITLLENIELKLDTEYKSYIYILKSKRKDQTTSIKTLSIKQLRKITELENILDYTKGCYFDGKLYDCNLENKDLTRYFKSI